MAQRMDKKLFKSLGDIPNARGGWMLVSDAVASELIGDDVFSLPHIQDGSHFQLGDIILKEEKSLTDRRIFRKTPSAIRAGCLTEFIKPCDNNTENQTIASIFKNRSEDRDFNPNFVFLKELTKNGITKSIRVEVVDCKKICLSNIPEENSMFRSFNEGFFNFFTKFYLISTLYQAQKVRVVVRINDKTDVYTTSSPDWTIAFKMHRYNFNKPGDFKAPSEKSPKTMKIKIMPRFMFPGFKMDRQPPPSETQNHDQGRCPQPERLI